MKLPHLIESAQHLVRMGVYSLYRCAYEPNDAVKYVLMTHGEEGACGCGGGGRPEYWLLGGSGMTLLHLKEPIDVEILGVVHLCE